MLLYRNFAFIILGFNLPGKCRVSIAFFILFSSLKIEKSVLAYKTPQNKQNTNRTICFLFQSISKKQVQVHGVSIAEKNIQNTNRNVPAKMLSKRFKFYFGTHESFHKYGRYCVNRSNRSSLIGNVSFIYQVKFECKTCYATSFFRCFQHN